MKCYSGLENVGIGGSIRWQVDEIVPLFVASVCVVRWSFGANNVFLEKQICQRNVIIYSLIINLSQLFYKNIKIHLIKL